MGRALQEIRIVPGFDREMTPALAQANVVDGAFVRWKEGLFEKIGGWVKYYPNSLGAIARCIWGWQDVNLNLRLAYGAAPFLKVLTTVPPATSPGTPQDITPQTTITNSIPNFTTQAVPNANTVIIVDPAINGPSVNNWVDIQTPVAVGGIVLYGLYQINTVLSSDSYTIVSPVAATSASSADTLMTIATTAGSSLAVVTLPNHGLQLGSSFAIRVPVTVGTGPGSLTFSGNYQAQALLTGPISSTQFGILANTPAVMTASATQNGSNARIAYYVTLGPQTGGSGWGVGAWGSPPGNIASHGAIIGGTGYTNGTYTSVPLIYVTSGPGTNATANITVSGGIVTTVTLVDGGQNFAIGDNLTASSAIIGAGSGFSVPVATVNPAGGWGTGIPIPSGAGSPITATDWSLFNWGEILIANPAGGGIYQWGPESSLTNCQLIGQGPVVADGCFLATPQQIIVAWGVASGQNNQTGLVGTIANIGVINPLRIVWSDAGNFNNWTASPSSFAGGFNLSSGSKIVAGLQGANQFALFTDIGVWSGAYVGQPLVFSINEIMQGCGLIGRKAAGKFGTSIWWMSQNQFFTMASGGVPSQIPCSVWDKVFQNINRSPAALQNIRFFSNAQFNEVGWYFPSGTSVENDTYVKYDIVQNLWDYGPLGRSAWIDQSILGTPIGTSNGTQGTLSGYIYQHEQGTDADGSPINWSLLTGDAALGTGDEFQFVDYLIPDFRYGKEGQAATAQVTITFFAKGFPSDGQPGNNPVVTSGPFTVSQSSPFVEPRLRGRTVAMLIQGGDLGSFVRGGLMRYRGGPDGRNP